MKSSAYILIIGIIMLLLAILLLSGTPTQENGETAAEVAPTEAEHRPVVTDQETTAVTVYYATPDGGQLLPLTLNINATTDVARVALEKLLAGPPDDMAADSVPTDAKLLDVYSIYHTVYVDFTREFLDISAADAQMAVDAITATVLPLVDGYKLQFLIEGQGRDYLRFVYIEDPLSLPLINPLEPELRAQLSEQGADFAELICYRVDAASAYLVPETLPVALDTDQPPTQTLARAALSHLLPPEWALLSLTISDDIAAVDLSIPAGTDISAVPSRLLAEALVRTLTGIEGIAAVQFLEQGQPTAFAPPGSTDKTLFAISAPINNHE